MYKNIKNLIHTNFLALAGYPLLWYIKESIIYIINAPLTMYETKSFTAFGYLTSFIFCPYMFLTLIIALFLYLIGFICKKIRKINPKEKQNSLFYNIFFNIGFSLYLFFTLFFVCYIFVFIIRDIFHID